MSQWIGAVLAGAVAGLATAQAQGFPDHAVKVVVPYPAGGPIDTVARVATQGLGGELGQSVYIENVAGAAVIARLNAAVNAQLTSAATAAAVAKLGLATRVVSPQAYGEALRDEARLWQAVVREAGVQLD